MAKVILDAEVFKALASPTRLAVLRALDERRKTVTELARDLDLNKATVHEHLQLLVATGLVRKRDDEGRKWIYYELTWNGERLLHPQETTSFMVMLGISVAAAGGGVALLGRSLGLWWQGQQLRAPDERDLPVERQDAGTSTPAGLVATEADGTDAGPRGDTTGETSPPTASTTQDGQTATQTGTSSQTGTQTATQTATQTTTATSSQTATQTSSPPATQTSSSAQATSTAGGGGGGMTTDAGAGAPATSPSTDLGAMGYTSNNPDRMYLVEASDGEPDAAPDADAFPDDDGWLALALLITAIVLAAAAYVMRRAGWSQPDDGGADAADASDDGTGKEDDRPDDVTEDGAEGGVDDGTDDR